jgi:hypothetical protein
MTPAERNTQNNPERQFISEPFTYWRKCDGHFLGYLNAYPDHWTQGDDLVDLKVQLLSFRPQVVVVLQGQPAFGAPAHHARQTQGHVRRQAALAAD